MSLSPETTDAATEDFLAALDVRMRAELARTPAALPARTLLDAGGKRLRAQLLWWSANATSPKPVDPEGESLIRAAAAIEFAHLGSLIHDDIVDGGDSRRGIATVHRQYGVHVATDAGAALAHLASEIVATLGPQSRRAARRAVLATCRGQMRELSISFVPVSPSQRLAIMYEKTAAFFELAAALGAFAIDAPASSRSAVCRFARRYGIAFQIADDVLDLNGDPFVLGRSNGADLRDGVMTLPLLLALDPNHQLSREMARIRVSPNEAGLTRCAELIDKGGGIEAATCVARWCFSQAAKALSLLTETRGRSELLKLAYASVERGLRPGRRCFATTFPAQTMLQSPSSDLSRSSNTEVSVVRDSIDPRLMSVLDWFLPGLSTSLLTRTTSFALQTRRQTVRNTLRKFDRWSAAADAASDAIALACGITDTYASESELAVALPLIDALHCASIGLLSSDAPATEHATMASRFRDLAASWADPAPSLRIVPRQSFPQMSAPFDA